MDKFSPKKHSESDALEDDGNLIIQTLVRKNDRVKLTLGGNDKTPNRDGFIHLLEKQRGVGQLEVQVKPIHSGYPNSPCYQLNASLVGYSRTCGLPFLLVCYDRKKDKAYWKRIDESLFEGVKDNQQSVRVYFEPADEIDEHSGYTDKWFRISEEHLQAIASAKQLKEMLCKASSLNLNISGWLETPEALIDALQQVVGDAADRFQTRLNDARKLLQNHEIKAATDLVTNLEKEIAKTTPSNELSFKVQILLGNCHLRLEDYEAAETSFRNAYAIDDSSIKSIANLAHILFVQNKLADEALTLAQKAYGLESENEFVLATYIFCLSFNKKYKIIDSLLKEHSDLIGKSSLLQLALGQESKLRNDYSTAEKFFKQSTAIDSSNFHAYILTAEAIYKGIRHEASLQLAKNVVPDLLSFGSRIADALEQLKKASEGLSKTSDKLALTRAYELNAMLNMVSGDFESVLGECQKVFGVIPAKPSTMIIKAQACIQLNRCAEALQLLSSVQDPGSRDIWQLTAYVHYLLNQPAEAAKFYTKYIEESDSDQEWFSYAQCLWLSGNRKKAYQTARFLRLAGRAPVVIMREIELKRLFEIQDMAPAIEVLDCLIDKDPTDAEHWLNRLAMHMNLGWREKAIVLHQQLPRDLIAKDGWARPKLAELEAELRNRNWIK